ITIAIGGALSADQLAAAGSIAINVISLNTLSHISDAVVNSAGSIIVTANNNADAVAISGAFAGVDQAKNGQAKSTSAMGFAIAVNVISNDLRDGGTLAYVEDSQINADGDLIVVADTQSSIVLMAVAAAINAAGKGATTSVAVGFGLNVISTRTRAYLRGKKNDESFDIGGDVRVNASDTSQAFALNFSAGIAASNKQTTVAAGAGLMFNVVATDIQAYIVDTTVVSNNVDVHATSDGGILAAAVGFAGAEGNAVAGQFALNYTQQDVIAKIDNTTSTSHSGDVDVNATSSSTIRALTGAAALGWANSSGNGVGAALSFNVTNDTTEATIDSSSVTASDGDVIVEAIYTATVETITAGLAVGKQVGIGGSVSTVVLTNETRARITNSIVDADRNAFVHADQDGVIYTIAGAAGIAKETVGIGASLAVTVVDNTTEAYVDNSTVFARANDADFISVPTWSDRGVESSEDVAGLAVIASTTETFNLISVTAGFSKKGAGAINLAPTILTDTTYAYLEDTDVNSSGDAGGDVLVRSHQGTDFFTFVGAASYGSSLSVGIAADGLFVINDTQAWVADTDTSESTGNGIQQIYAGGDFEVSSNTSTEVDAGVVGIGIGGESKSFAGAGSIEFMSLDSVNKATVTDMDINAGGNLTIDAHDFNRFTRIAGSATFGTASVGATALVVTNNNVTESVMAGTHSNAGGQTSVTATSNLDNSSTWAVAGAVGVKGAFNGVFTFYVARTDTRAIIEGGSRQAQVNQDANYSGSGQSVVVQARDLNDMLILEGGAAVGLGPLGAGGNLLWLDVQNTVDAHIGNFSIVSATDNIDVLAESDKEFGTFGGGLSFGTGVGFAGTFIIATIGSGASSGSLTDDVGSDVFAAVNEAIDAVNELQGLATSQTPSKVRTSIANTDPTLSRLGTVDRSVQDVGAFVGEFAQITAGGDLTVSATETVDYFSAAGSVALAGGNGFGASVTLITVGTVTEAFIDDDAIVVVDGTVTVAALANETADLNAIAAAGSAAFGLGAQYGQADIESDQFASIGNDVKLSNAANVIVDAGHIRDAEVTGNGVALGTVAAGLSGATVNMSGNVRAEVDGSLLGEVDADGNVVGLIGGLDVTAFSTVTQARTNAPALAGGIGLAVAGSLAQTNVDPDVVARIGNATEVYVDGDVNITATTDQRAKAAAVGQNGALGVTIGLSGSTAVLEPHVDTSVDSHSAIIADSVTIQSLHNVVQSDGTAASGSAVAEATSSGGAVLLGVQGSWAKAEPKAVVTTTIEDASIVATNGGVLIQSKNWNSGNADARGDSFA
ncbi:MAG: hypothetical protein KDB23_21280, partial [Planctomycetales bacterium]|nr:hypothetical protein [Planctomycetales bacterium]